MKIMEYQEEGARLDIPSMREQCTDVEWQTRVDLAACYRLIDLHGMSDLISTHISARIPETDEFLINPYGYFFDEITASSLVKVSIDGEVLSRAHESLAINPAGYMLHSAVHQVRDDAMCVIHTHTRAGSAVAAMECGLLPLNQTGMRFFDGIGYHTYEGPVVNLEERERVQASLGEHNALILRNHGLLTCGPTVAEAFHLMRALERSCQIQIDAMSCQTPLHIPSQKVLETTAHLFKRSVRRPYGVKEWDGHLRRLDKIDSSYRN